MYPWHWLCTRDTGCAQSHWLSDGDTGYVPVTLTLYSWHWEYTVTLAVWWCLIYTAFTLTEPVAVLGSQIPYLWLWLACNTVFQYICINTVFQLTTECTSLTGESECDLTHRWVIMWPHSQAGNNVTSLTGESECDLTHRWVIMWPHSQVGNNVTSLTGG